MSSIKIVQLTPEELSAYLAQAVKEQFTELKSLFKANEKTELLTRSEIASLLKVDKSTIYNWTRSGVLKSYSIKGRVYFKRSEIESALTELKTK
jgi:excisionase family DNA binding protein